ncbi:DUF997 family protein [uncultured Gemella sp.]|uniref:DUF997 family protein n=1 Tax=uncultured Gemella sp. TaxID=254352 RepID=UPI0028D5CB3F|nr:DUF997 family protein [uncultured Gemella sp.]
MNKLKNKEGIIAIFIAIIHFTLWYYFAYVKFDVNNVKSYKYILGLPEWFFYSSVAVSIIIIILVIVCTNLLLNDEIKEEEK